MPCQDIEKTVETPYIGVANNKTQPGCVVIGVSGGVDSAVAALLLQQQGHNVIGAFMQNWPSDDPNCPAATDLEDARTVCKKLNIPLHVINFTAEYWDNVFKHFLDEYAAYRTPNPDIICNKEIKFKAFLEHAKTLGATHIATGHYADNLLKDGQHYLLKGSDDNKDQSYFLHTLNQYQLAHAIFPLARLNKSMVRKIAEDFGLANYAKKDSTGICFIGERNFKNFLKEYLLTKPGEIVTTEEELSSEPTHKLLEQVEFRQRSVGRHDGLMYYTIGQRQGLGIGGQKNARETPWYVAAKDISNNQLIVTQDKNHPALMRTQLTCCLVHWISGFEPTSPLTCAAKIRHRQTDQTCEVNKLDNDRWQVTFNTPQWAISPGQSVVLYQNNVCLGGGIIE